MLCKVRNVQLWLRFVTPRGRNMLKRQKVDAMYTVIFDLDGTLADTSGDLIASANACFRDMGHGDILDPVADAGTALRGGRAMLRKGLEKLGRESDEELIDRYYPVLLEAYRKDIDKHTRFFDGALETVEVLKARGHRVGICTNKPEALAHLLLTRLNVLDRFHSLIGADTLATRKPDAAPYIAAVNRAGGEVNKSCLIGDTKTDRDTAIAAGVPCVLVDFGVGDQNVYEMDADAIIKDFAELPAIIEEWGQAAQ